MTKVAGIQLRAICYACGRQQAVDEGDKVAHHGYQVKWSSFVGPCVGGRRAHFNTAEGKQLATVLRAQHAKEAARFRSAAKTNTKGARYVPLTGKSVVVDDPTPKELAVRTKELLSMASMYQASADDLCRRLDEWSVKAPTEHEVLRGGVLHLYGERLRGKACASSFDGASKGDTTQVEANVSCIRCMDIIRLRHIKENAAIQELAAKTVAGLFAGAVNGDEAPFTVVALNPGMEVHTWPEQKAPAARVRFNTLSQDQHHTVVLLWKRKQGVTAWHGLAQRPKESRI